MPEHNNTNKYTNNDLAGGPLAHYNIAAHVKRHSRS
ncbi:hypothetical protein M2103_000323 [Ereboglobus sp. PH5-5]|nr:hypothetical protein [Ereboglobus sp. PH5-5]